MPTKAIDKRSKDLTTFTIRIEGKKIPEVYEVSFLSITKAFNRISCARLELLDGNVAKQVFDTSNQDFLIPGKGIEILGGYNSDEDLLFKGVITKHKIKMKKRGDSILEVECKDASFQMTLARQSRCFENLSDSDLFEELGNIYQKEKPYTDILIETESSEHIHSEIIQYQVSDWDFLVSRAEKIGMQCLANDGTIYIFKPSSSQQPVMKIEYGKDMFDFDIEMDSRLQYSEVKASCWNIADQDLLSADTEDVSTATPGNIAGSDLAEFNGSPISELRHSGRLTQEELDTWVESKMSKTRWGKIKGTIKIQGTHTILPGNLVTLAGLSDRFNGLALVSGIRHSLVGNGDWFTFIEIGTNPLWHHQIYPINPEPNSGFNISISGLHSATVSHLEGDPEGEDRISVDLPTCKGIWARISTLDAGNNRGTVFRPEINDEVILGFIDGDPNQAVVLGMVHSSNKPSPIPASDKNHEKGWVTRKNMKLLFNDEDASILIETPNGNKIVLNDSDKKENLSLEDENGNSIILNKHGITLNSSKDIILTAKQDIKVKGKSLDMKMDTSANIEGGISASLKSGGTTEVKGSIVKIN